MKILTAEKMRTIDRIAIEETGIPGIVLMENAAFRVIEVIKNRYNLTQHSKVGIVVGKGNNGGDGLAVARHLSNMGTGVRIYIIADKKKISGDAKINLGIVEKMGLQIFEINNSASFHKIKTKIIHETLLIDSILGTGTSKPVTGLYAEVINFVNSLQKPVLSIDIPSGLSADAGIITGDHIRADITVALAHPKMCHFSYPAAESCGDIEVVDIGIPNFISDSSDEDCMIITEEYIKRSFPVRSANSHKGTYGHLLAICGSTGKGGAAALSTASALRVGAGLVTLALPESLNSSFETELQEIMTIPLHETAEGTISEKAYEKIMNSLGDKKGVLMGPGLTTNDSTSKFVLRVIRESKTSILLDADALNIISDNMNCLKKRTAPTILTPHPGEMARMWGVTAREVQSDRMEFAVKTSLEYNAYVVLKGAGTIIAVPDGSVYLNTTGNPGMATAGTGDVLAGMISGFLVQGFEPVNASIFGVYFHGLAGDIAAGNFGEYSLTAGDLIHHIPDAIHLKKYS